MKKTLSGNMVRISVFAAILLVIVFTVCACSKADTSTVMDNTLQSDADNGTNNGGTVISETEPTSDPTSTPSPTPKPTATPTPTPVPKPTIEALSAGNKAFRDSLGRPCFSLYVEYKCGSFGKRSAEHSGI